MRRIPQLPGMPGTLHCQYDAWNRLVRVEGLIGQIWQYEYDESGNRIEKNAPAETTYCTWDEDNRLVAAEPPAGVSTALFRILAVAGEMV